jgi:hypothetical protein
MRKTLWLRGRYDDRLIKSWLDEDVVDRRVKLILWEERIKNYVRNLTWITKWLWLCLKYMTEKPRKKLLAWHSNMYYKWGTCKGGEDDTGIHQVLDGGSGERRPIKPSDSD